MFSSDHRDLEQFIDRNSKNGFTIFLFVYVDLNFNMLIEKISSILNLINKFLAILINLIGCPVFFIKIYNYGENELLCLICFQCG